MKPLLILYSYHHRNTEKIAQAMAKALDAIIANPQHVTDIRDYDLIGFGSGIYGGKHHQQILELLESLPNEKNKKAFIFSTYGAPEIVSRENEIKKYTEKNHRALREKLLKKGYIILDEFSCPGYNTNSFLKLFGGINIGRPNAQDIKRAQEFALNIKHRISEDSRD